MALKAMNEDDLEIIEYHVEKLEIMLRCLEEQQTVHGAHKFYESLEEIRKALK